MNRWSHSTLTDCESGVRRRPGRPRDEDLEQLVLDAALEMIGADQEIAVSKLVERSGVNRAAFYRRWPSMTLLIASALNTGRVVPPVISLEGDLGGRTSSRRSLATGRSKPWRCILVPFQPAHPPGDGRQGASAGL